MTREELARRLEHARSSGEAARLRSALGADALSLRRRWRETRHRRMVAKGHANWNQIANFGCQPFAVRDNASP
jgi:hypothetical protein